MYKRFFTKFVVFFLCLIATVGCTKTFNEEEQKVVNTLTAMFKAMSNHDIEKTKELLIPTGQYHSFNPKNHSIHVGSFEEYIKSLKNKRTYSEHLLKPTKVEVIGNVATLISRYKFYVDETLSHYGDEVFTFLKKDGKWIITGSTYTVEK